MIAPTLRGRAWGRLLLGAVGLVVALGAAAPVAAYITISRQTMYRDTLNGAQVTLTIPTSENRVFSTASQFPPYQYTLLGAPSGLTVTVNAVTRSSNGNQSP